MPKKLNLEKDRYKIIALLSECFLFEYYIESKEFYIFDGYIQLPEDMRVIENFRYNQKILKLIVEEDLERFNEFCNELDSVKDTHTLEIRLFNKDRVAQWHKLEGKTVFSSEYRPEKIVGKIYNIDVQKKEKQKLKEKSEKDTLTTLYNKATTEKQIGRCLRGENLDTEGALFLIDFDNFKGLNDTLGHLFGDSVLRDVTAKLKELFRNTDVLGRVGGDEFVAYINGNASEDLARKKAEAIKHIFDGLYENKQKQLVTSCSIGIAFAPIHGNTYKELFKKADIALYQAKNKGKGRFQIFDDRAAHQKILNKSDLFYTYEANEENSISKSFIDNIVLKIFNILYSAADINGAIEEALGITANRYDFTRVYINELSEDGRTVKTSYEWVDPNVDLKDTGEIKMSVADFKEWKEMFNTDGMIYCGQIEEIKDLSERTFRYLKSRKVKSFLQCAIFSEGKILGYLGFDDCIETRPLDKREILNLVTIGRVIGTYICQLRIMNYYKQEDLIQKEVAKNQNLMSYILKANSFELLYTSNHTKQLYPQVKIGDLCYESFQGRKVPCENCPLYGLSEEKQNNVVDFYNKVKELRLKATASRIMWGNEKANLICASEITDFVEIIQGKDDLTGLPSLTKFEKDAAKLIIRGNNQYALVSVDIDKFKNINGLLGYQEGNKLLIKFVNTISSKLKLGELFCRSNADKFLIMAEYDTEEAIFIRMNGLIDFVSDALRKDYPSLHIVVAGGMYITAVGDMEIGLAIDKANIARKSIKGSHKSRIAVYDDKIHRRLAKEKSVEARMVSALSNNEFVVYMQPKIELSSKKIVGAEALVRWKTDSGALIPPNDFIPIFEKNGFINQLDFYVYEKVFEKMRDWMRSAKRLIPVSINISREHITDKNFVSKLKNLVNHYNIPPNLVELEITESMFLNETRPLLVLLDELKAIGFNLSIDDFGTGYSSLNLLRHLKMDVLKLDKEFFGRELVSKKESIVLTNVVRMAKELGMIVLSEGVETKEQDSYLTEIGCDLAQGYYFSKPMPMSELELLVNGE